MRTIVLAASLTVLVFGSGRRADTRRASEVREWTFTSTVASSSIARIGLGRASVSRTRWVQQ